MVKEKKRNYKASLKNYISRFFLWILWGLLILVALLFAIIAVYKFVNPSKTIYILTEGRRLKNLTYEWRDIEQISPNVSRAIVAAEDANFCNHWGFDIPAIRLAIENGGSVGASTISQQTVKNVFLWQGRSWPRKALEAIITPLVEAIWSKKRILEIYMNIAEFDEGVFGIATASMWYFGVDAKNLSLEQSSLLAATLPNPKNYSARIPTSYLKERAKRISSGAVIIRLDGRSTCFEG